MGRQPKSSFEITLEQLGSDRMMLFSSDYPHWHYDDDDAIAAGFSPDLIRRICVENPLETYPRCRACAKETT